MASNSYWKSSMELISRKLGSSNGKAKTWRCFLFSCFSCVHLLNLGCSVQVGYLLGLGDRHPSNLMLHRYRYYILLLLHFLADDKIFNIFMFVIQWEDSAYWLWRLLWSFNESGEVSREGKLLYSKDGFPNCCSFLRFLRGTNNFLTNFYV